MDREELEPSAEQGDGRDLACRRRRRHRQLIERVRRGEQLGELGYRERLALVGERRHQRARELYPLARLEGSAHELAKTTGRWRGAAVGREPRAAREREHADVLSESAADGVFAGKRWVGAPR
jgi:hypothetical protein